MSGSCNNEAVTDIGMKHSVLKQSREAFRRRFASRRHTALLAAIITVFAVRPLIGDTGFGPPVFSITLLLLLMVAVYNINVDELVGERKTLLAERRRRNIIVWALAVPAVLDRFAVVFAPSRSRYLAGAICWLLLFAFITWYELRGVLRQKEVTSETISMSISVYLLIGFTWALFYIVLHVVQPLAFSLGGSPASLSEQQVFPVLTYFSLTTLSTIGFGDITPVTLQARYAAVTEGITGQFYLAILVARLVGMQMSQAASRHEEHRPNDSDSKREAG
jgi:hypothetical protein